MIFDQYSRYKACADLLLQSNFVEGSSILDIGSGPECLFGQFMPNADMSYVDPLMPTGAGHGRIIGDVFVNALDDRFFDCVTAVDVLEHVPPEHRRSFLARISSLCRGTLVLGFPSADASDALATDNFINGQYRAIYDTDYPWLDEHCRFGLPSLVDTVEQLAQMGWHCQTVGHGHAPWLRELLSFVICVWNHPGLNAVVEEISGRFNRELYHLDFRAPFYRNFVVASRFPLPTLVPPGSNHGDQYGDEILQSIFDDGRRLFFSASLRHLAKIESNQVLLNSKIHEVSNWANELNRSMAERDGEIDRLGAKIAEVSSWGSGLNSLLAEREAEIERLGAQLQEVSSWGTGLNNLLAQRDAEITRLGAKVEELSSWGADLNSLLAKRDSEISVSPASSADLVAQKHAELMRMSDWADGMRRELERRDASLTGKAINNALRAKHAILHRLSNSVVGNLARIARDHLRYQKTKVSLDLVRQSLAANDGKLIITFPIITWDFRWQRPQHIVTRLRNRGYSVLYVAMSLAVLGRKVRGRTEAGSLLGFNQLDQHIQQIWLHSASSINVYTDPIECDNLLNIVAGLEAVITELKPKSIHYLLQFPGWWPVAERLRALHGGKVVFDCMDDHSGFSTNSSIALQTEEQLIKQADLVITSSNVLEKKVRALNPSTVQVKNGTEYEHFTDPKQNGELDHFLGRPIIGYYGAISDWFDMGIVSQCAQAHPEWHFILIGATFGADLAPIEGLGNVHLLGEKKYADLPGYLAYFDVCTIPFKVIPLTLATNPVKFYEYLSAGKPVVAVALPELLPYQEDCYLANADASDFDTLLLRALDERHDQAKIARRKALAKENSWDSRAITILNAMTHL